MLSQLTIIGLRFVRYPNAREVIPQIWLNIHNKMFSKCKKGLTKEHLDTIIGYYFSEWMIPEVQRRRGEARSGRTVSLYSAPFYTGRHGYKMCLRLYMDGDGSGKGTHLSFFLTLMRWDYDAQLKWPFDQVFQLIFVNQKQQGGDIVHLFKPDPASPSFKQPHPYIRDECCIWLPQVCTSINPGQSSLHQEWHYDSELQDISCILNIALWDNETSCSY